MTYKNVCRLSAVFFLLAAIFTRIYIWTANPKAIWLDEAMLSTAIWRDAWATVLKGQLDFFQSAPLGFLALTKLLATFFGDGIRVLRFLPMVASCAAFFFIWKIGNRAKLSPAAVAAWMFFAAVCYPLLWYADEFKPYGIEVLFTLIFIDCYLKNRDRLTDGVIPWSVVALIIASFFFTLAGAFDLLAIFSVLIFSQKSGARFFFTRNLGKLALIILVGALYYNFYLHHNAVDSDFMRDFWEKTFALRYVGYPLKYAVYIAASVFYHSAALWENVCAISSSGKINGIFFVIAALIGFGFCIRRREPLGLIVALILFFRAFAFAARLYPFGFTSGLPTDVRMMLSMFPPMMLIAAIGIGAVCDWLDRVKLKVLLTIFLAAAIYVAMNKNSRAVFLGNTEYNNPEANIAMLGKIYTADSQVMIDGPMASLFLYAERHAARKIPFEIAAQMADQILAQIAFQHLEDNPRDEVIADLTSRIAQAQAANKRRIYVLLYFPELAYGPIITEYLRENYAVKMQTSQKTALIWFDIN